MILGCSTTCRWWTASSGFFVLWEEKKQSHAKEPRSTHSSKGKGKGRSKGKNNDGRRLLRRRISDPRKRKPSLADVGKDGKKAKLDMERLTKESIEQEVALASKEESQDVRSGAAHDAKDCLSINSGEQEALEVARCEQLIEYPI